jgi:hypothetical protein
MPLSFSKMKFRKDGYPGMEFLPTHSSAGVTARPSHHSVPVMKLHRKYHRTITSASYNFLSISMSGVRY